MKTIRMAMMIASFAVAALSVTTARGDLLADVADDFSPTSNPNGVWSYGYAANLNDPLTLFTHRGDINGVDYWSFGANFAHPSVFHNATAAPINIASNVVIQPGQLALHPGPQGQYSVVRYTADDVETRVVAGAFRSDLDPDGATTDVHILHNGVSIFSDEVTGSNAAIFDMAVSLQPGDTVDFRLGFGSNGTFFHDSTSLSATLIVPEPTSLIIFALTGTMLMRRRRR